jgi:molecular chaperone GrpE
MKDDEKEVVMQAEEIEAPHIDAHIDTGEGQDMVFEESDEEGMALGSNQKMKALKDQIKELQKEKQEYLDGWQRARADYANLQKTTDDDRKRLRTMIEENFIEELIPVVDSFSMAMSNKEAWEKVDANWRTGVEYIYQQLINTLKERGFATFGAIGESFDPTLHEAVSEVETEDPTREHTIATVLQQGYKLGDNVLRAARVSVYSKK